MGLRDRAGMLYHEMTEQDLGCVSVGNGPLGTLRLIHERYTGLGFIVHATPLRYDSFGVILIHEIYTEGLILIIKKISFFRRRNFRLLHSGLH